MSSKSQPVFFPLEVQHRELVGKLFLAVHLASRGIPVFIGHKAEVYSLANNVNSPGILFNKSVGLKNNRGLYSNLREKGSLIFAQDEEAGIVFRDYSDFYIRRRSLDDVNFLDKWFCWGNREYAFLRELNTNSESKLLVSGSPRTVIWGEFGSRFWKEEIDSIKGMHKQYVLVLTNNVLSNSYLPDSLLFSKAREGGKLDDSMKNLIESKIQFEKDCTDLFLECIEQVLRVTKMDVLIRTHPAESPGFWVQKFKNNSRVHITSQGAVSPWIIASDIVLHNGSTTALEAFYLGKPVVGVLPQHYDLGKIPKSVPFDISTQIIRRSSEIEFEFNNYRTPVSHNKDLAEVLREKISFVGTLAPVHLISSAIESNVHSISKNYNFELKVPDWKNLVFPLQEARRQIRISRKNKKFDIMDKYKRPPLKNSEILSYAKKVIDILNVNEDLIITKVSANSYCLTNR